MRNQPTGEQLLDSAERLLREQLIPLLPPPQRRAGLMIAKAMAIAARQLYNGEQPLHEERAALAALLGDEAPGDSGDLTMQVLQANRTLGRLIRAGRADQGEYRQQVYTHLLDSTRRTLAESNPCALVELS
jgi:hypothetical protein